MLAVVSTWRFPLLPAEVLSWWLCCHRGVVSPLSVPAGCDCDEFPPGLTPVYLHRARVAALACAATRAGLLPQFWDISWDTSCSKAAVQLKT